MGYLIGKPFIFDTLEFNRLLGFYHMIPEVVLIFADLNVRIHYNFGTKNISRDVLIGFSCLLERRRLTLR